MLHADELARQADWYERHGDVIRAEQFYRQSLMAPGLSDEIRLDVVRFFLEQEQPEPAQEVLRPLLEQPSPDVEALRCEGLAWAQSGAWEDAARVLREVLSRRPEDAESWSDLGAVLARLERYSEAEAALQRALELCPELTEALCNLGGVRSQLKRPGEAIACYRQALGLQPDQPAVFNNLGTALLRLGRPAEAEPYFRMAARLQPESVDAQYNLGLVLTRQEAWTEALEVLLPLGEQHPRHLGVQRCLAQVHERLGHAEVAAEHAARAGVLDADSPWALLRAGHALLRERRLDDAETQYRAAVAKSPDLPEAHLALGMCLLQAGRWLEGWPEYEWRLRCSQVISAPPPLPRWQGAPVADLPVIIQGEQGLGDTLQMLRYVPLVTERCRRVWAVVSRPLVELVRGFPGLEHVQSEADPLPESGWLIPAASLPGVFQTTVETVPPCVPFLRPDPQLVARWKERLRDYPGVRVGIAWQGSKRYAGDAARSFQLQQFRALADLPGLRLISLQKGEGTEQLAEITEKWEVLDFSDELDTHSGPFQDTLALLSLMDVVIVADSALGHLAGTLGRPVWIPQTYHADWRWLLDREDSPWYPTLRLFRQTTAGDWDGVFQRLRSALCEQFPSLRRTRPLSIEVSPGEVSDKITILEIKEQRITDPTALQNVRNELVSLRRTVASHVTESEELSRLVAELREVNEVLWQIEDDIRACERVQDFGERFIALARSVYHRNDARGRLKRQINDLLQSEFVEEKCYTDYSGCDSQKILDSAGRP